MPLPAPPQAGDENARAALGDAFRAQGYDQERCTQRLGLSEASRIILKFPDQHVRIV